ncbi:HAD family hydrolase [Selenomonas sp.]|uniref:haloacid dehalogenase-like hydrolase n=1 Tax=Selenomonas sp. TaxID=2053611 RepID=UPI0025CC52C9|nr:HAD family hydrolase [Selenomonas sp.]MCI6283712.1 haloacid dehalogenase-like hydrolase [Selenomonas sp.]
MNRKHLCAALLALGVAVGIGAPAPAQAMARMDIAAISVRASGANFRYWNKDAASYQALTDYVKDVTARMSMNYIPPEARVAVFDMDGTLMGELTPLYFEWMMYVHRVLDDPSYAASEEDVSLATTIREGLASGGPINVPGDALAQSQARVFAGMTLLEYDDYVRQFMETPAEGLAVSPNAKSKLEPRTYLKRGEAFFLPMVEVMSYLKANGFDVWIVSGSDREALRVLADGVLPVDRTHIIGKDVQYVASGQGETESSAYVFEQKSDVIVRGELLQRDVCMDKVGNIVRSIGRQPVLAFGNSAGDAAMMNYTLAKNQYKSMAFAVLCDDTEDDLGNEAQADVMRTMCEETGWMPISMRDDWKTVYGNDVKVAENDAETDENEK